MNRLIWRSSQYILGVVCFIFCGIAEAHSSFIVMWFLGCCGAFLLNFNNFTGEDF